MLHQSFLNLFINAMQAMPEGGHIRVGLHAEGGRVFIEIEDAGQGIPADLSEKIWDPFFTTKDKGTGLGLGIVKNIIEAHGGSIRIANRKPQGAHVTIELPVHTPEGNA
jgi:signal transduction histidine kinase